MATTIYEVLTSDTPNSGRVKFNDSISNLKTTADATATLLTGIGDPVGTTNTVELTNKTIVSDNVTGTKNNIIQISRLDVKDDIFTISGDTGIISVGIDGGTITNLDILGGNGIETYVDTGILYIKNPQNTVLNLGSQTFTIGSSSVTSGYTMDVNNYSLFRSGISVGPHSSVPTDQLHISGTDNSVAVTATIRNLGTAGSVLKLIYDNDSEPWYIKRTTDNNFTIGKNTADIVFIDEDATENTLTIAASSKIGINSTTPQYTLQIASGIGLDSTTIYMHGTDAKILDQGGAMRFLIEGAPVLELRDDGNIGIGSLAQDNKRIYISGDLYIASGLTLESTLNVSGLVTFAEDLSVNNKFTVDSSTGNTYVAGTMLVSGITNIQTTNISGNLTLADGNLLTVDDIRPITESGISFYKYGQTSGSILRILGDSSGLVQIGVGFPTEDITDYTLGLYGSLKIKNSSSNSNYLIVSPDNTENSIICSSYDDAEQVPLSIKIAGDGSAAKALDIYQGTTDVINNLDISLSVKPSSTSINPTDTGVNPGPEVLNVYSATTTDRPVFIRVAGDTWISSNSYYDTNTSTWKNAKGTTGGAVGAFRLGFPETNALGNFSLQVAPDGTQFSATQWVEAINIDDAGNVAIQTDPDQSYALKINGTLYSTAMELESLSVSQDFTTSNIILTDTAADSLNTAGGIEADKTIIAKTTGGGDSGFRLYALDDPNTAIHTIIEAKYSGTSYGGIRVENDPSSSATRLALYSQSSTYPSVYSKKFHAGNAFYAAYDEQPEAATPKWCPVPFVVFSKVNPFPATDLVSSSSASINIRLPRKGVYRVLWNYYAASAPQETNGTDNRKIYIGLTLDGSAIAQHYFRSNVEENGGDNPYLSYFDHSGTIMGLFEYSEEPGDQETLIWTRTAVERMSSYRITAITVEWISDNNWTLVTP